MFHHKDFILLLLLLLFFSCSPHTDEHREEGKIFHATTPHGGSIGGLYFGLYKDKTYQICATGGIGQDCYNGKFFLNKDTLILLDLNKEAGLKSNKLLIVHYKQIDNMGSIGEVIQIDTLTHKNLGTKEDYFMIRMDSLGINR